MAVTVPLPSSDTMEVRLMAKVDAPAIHELHRACLTRSLRERYTDAQIAAWLKGRPPDGYLRAAEDGETFLVACADGAVIRYASWQNGELLSLFVHPDFHHAGVGSRLFETCSDEAARNDAPITQVKAALGAEGFHLRHGLKSVTTGSTIKQGVEIPDTRVVR